MMWLNPVYEIYRMAKFFKNYHIFKQSISTYYKSEKQSDRLACIHYIVYDTYLCNKTSRFLPDTLYCDFAIGYCFKFDIS